ncbi:MAG: hypothetical protein ACE5JI_14090 [Acidobacteriota bacterium]
MERLDGLITLGRKGRGSYFEMKESGRFALSSGLHGESSSYCIELNRSGS